MDAPPHTQQGVRDDNIRKRGRIESLGYTVIELDFRDGDYSKILDEVKN